MKDEKEEDSSPFKIPRRHIHVAAMYSEKGTYLKALKLNIPPTVFVGGNRRFMNCSITYEPKDARE